MVVGICIRRHKVYFFFFGTCMYVCMYVCMYTDMYESVLYASGNNSPHGFRKREDPLVRKH